MCHISLPAETNKKILEDNSGKQGFRGMQEKYDHKGIGKREYFGK